MKKRNAIQEIMEHTSEELNRLSPEEKEHLQTDALKKFGLPPLALRIWALLPLRGIDDEFPIGRVRRIRALALVFDVKEGQKI